MSNESTTPGPAEQPRPSLPQFDPNAPSTPGVEHADATQTLPSALTSELPVTPPTTPYAYAAGPAPAGPAPAGYAPIAGPAVPLAATGLPPRTGSGSSFGRRLDPSGDGAGPRWSGRKTAVTAGLAIVLASAGAIGAAAAVPAGSTGGDSFGGFGGRAGGGRNFQFPGGQGGFGQQNQQGQNGQQLPNLQNGLGGIDPNQLSQLDPQDLLRQLNQGVDPFSGGGSDDDSSTGTGTAKTT
jgi:hypothetical protein